jgi:formamidopyrimidine-DNA glycosylase
MPELPEVETTRRGIEPLVRNKRVERVLVHNGSLRWPVPADLETILAAQKVSAVDRRAKYLLMRFDRGTLIIHLGMTGQLRVCRSGEARRKHDHLELVFTDRSVLRFNDSRRFGALFWTETDPLQHERLAALGPEPLSELFNTDYLYQISRGRKVAVKPFIMDAGIVVGVGNIYASEALFRSGLSPLKQAGRVGRIAYARLIRSVREVLAEAIEAGGTTIRDFSGTDGRPGYFKQELRVYGRAGEPCPTCGSAVKQTRLGQRSTYYCTKCQK